MNISLLTIWHVGNYGAEMQTYASVKALRELGHEVVVLDFRLSDGFNKSIQAKLLDLVTKLSPNHRNFTRFWRTYIPSSRHYKSRSEIAESHFDSDVFMVGSDQVWNPDITREKYLVYFLDFVPQGSRKIAYASSFGIGQWKQPPEKTEKIKQLLSDFNAIGCRESQGVIILDQVFGRQAVHVLDPTLLFTSYPELVKEDQQQKNLAFYSLSHNTTLKNMAADIASRFHLELINNNTRSRLLNRRDWSRPSIEQWLQTFHDSKFVVTDSYHGTIFSILFHKPFITVYKGTKSSRIESLLTALGLSERFFSTAEEAMASHVWEKSIDYSIVDYKLNLMRNHSWNFLKKALANS